MPRDPNGRLRALEARLSAPPADDGDQARARLKARLERIAEARRVRGEPVDSAIAAEALPARLKARAAAIRQAE